MMKVRLSRRELLKTAGAVAAVGISTPSHAQQITLRIGAGHPAQALAYVTVADSFFVPEVQKRALAKGINVRFIKAWSGTVAKIDGIVEAVQKGSLDIGLSVPAFEQARAGLINYGLFFPFTTSDHLQQQKVIMTMLREVPALQESMRPYNVHVLQMSVSENYGMLLKKEVAKLGDLNGLKLACAGANAPWTQAVGAVPIQLPIGEVYQAMQTGLVDGSIYFKSGLAAFKLNEVVKVFVKAGFGCFPSNAAFMNLETRKKLPKDLVDTIDEVSVETSLVIAEAGRRRDEEMEAAFKDKVRFVDLPAEAQRAWGEAMRDLPARAAKDLDAKGMAGTETFRSYVRILHQAGYQFPYEYPI